MTKLGLIYQKNMLNFLSRNLFKNKIILFYCSTKKLIAHIGQKVDNSSINFSIYDDEI